MKCAAHRVVLLRFSSSVVSLVLTNGINDGVTSRVKAVHIARRVSTVRVVKIGSTGFLVLPGVINVVAFVPMLIVFDVFANVLKNVTTDRSAKANVAPTSFRCNLRFCFGRFCV